MGDQKNNKRKNIEKAEDVEFSYELADAEDLEANQRMKKADQRAENNNK